MLRETIIKISLVADFKYWTTGCINFNFHSGELEIEFLCFGAYFSREKVWRKIR